MTLYLFDINAVSALIHDPGGSVAQRLGLIGVEQVCTSIIVAAEIRYGAAKRGSMRLSQRAEQALEAISVLPFEALRIESTGGCAQDLRPMVCRSAITTC